MELPTNANKIGLNDANRSADKINIILNEYNLLPESLQTIDKSSICQIIELAKIKHNCDCEAWNQPAMGLERINILDLVGPRLENDRNIFILYFNIGVKSKNPSLPNFDVLTIKQFSKLGDLFCQKLYQAPRQ